MDPKTANRKKPVVLTPDPPVKTTNTKGKTTGRRQYYVGKSAFDDGEEVFTRWDEDGNYYSGHITGVENSKFVVSWYEGDDEPSRKGPNSIIRAKDILTKGRLVYVASPSRLHYDPATFVEYKGQGGRHRIKTSDGAVSKKMSDMQAMIEAREVKRWRCSEPSDSTNGTHARRARPQNSSTSLAGVVDVFSSEISPMAGCRTDSPSPEPRPIRPLRKIKAFVMPEKLKTERDPVFSGTPPFTGFSFLITSGSYTDPTFDRKTLVDAVHALGGTVVQTFAELISGGHGQFLIAPGPCRTAKYFSCLAADIPCVSHKWILEIRSKIVAVPFGKHRLPTGNATAGGKFMIWTPRERLLDERRIGVYGEPSVCESWMLALRAGRAHPTVVEELNIKRVLSELDCVVVVSGLASQELIKESTSRGVWLVSPEWLIQTLISGTYKPYQMWPYMHPTDALPA